MNAPNYVTYCNQTPTRTQCFARLTILYKQFLIFKPNMRNILLDTVSPT